MSSLNWCSDTHNARGDGIFCMQNTEATMHSIDRKRSPSKRTRQQHQHCSMEQRKKLSGHLAQHQVFTLHTPTIALTCLCSAPARADPAATKAVKSTDCEWPLCLGPPPAPLVLPSTLKAWQLCAAAAACALSAVSSCSAAVSNMTGPALTAAARRGVVSPLQS